MELNLSVLPEGRRYEDRYGKYIDIFKQVLDKIEAGEHVTVYDAPASWVPLLRYIGAWVDSWRIHFDADELVTQLLSQSVGFTRTEVEVLCGFRPECVDALWKVDAQWKSSHIKSEERTEFIVTCNGSFWRPEVRAYLDRLKAYVPTKRKVVLVPCAADKPYPSEMHSAVLARLPHDYYLMNVTGVLGLVPSDLWPVMPHYDSGIPNEWRVQNMVEAYFGQFEHESIVVYCDFYNLAIAAGLARSHRRGFVFVNEVKFYFDYVDLLDPKRLRRLEDCIARSEEAIERRAAADRGQEAVWREPT